MKEITLYEFIKDVISRKNVYCKGELYGRRFFLSSEMLFDLVESNSYDCTYMDNMIGDVVLGLMSRNFFSENDSSNYDRCDIENTIVEEYEVEESDDNILKKFFSLYYLEKYKNITIYENGSINKIIPKDSISEIEKSENILYIFTKGSETSSLFIKNIYNIYVHKNSIIISMVSEDSL